MNQVETIIRTALLEDMPMGDVTTDPLISPEQQGSARFVAKEDGVVAGLDVAARVFEILDPGTRLHPKVNEGDAVTAGTIIATLEGSALAMLKGERTALNLLQRMSGIATRTRQIVDIVSDFPVRIVDTRKTAPGLRWLDKYAVRCGGGSNHRFNLSDGVMIKDNHIRAAGSISRAVRKLRGAVPHTLKIEVEVESLEEVEEALEAGADIIMLDNMSLEQRREAIIRIKGRALTEISGNIGDKTPEEIRELASTGVDLISVGALTHSVRAMDISLRFNR